MGAREDQEHGRLEYQSRMARDISQQMIRYDQLIEEMDREAVRVADILSSADWAEAKPQVFIEKGYHWWQHNRTSEYACLEFCHRGQGRNYEHSLWMRSDNTLYVEDSDGTIRRPSDIFPYYSDWLLADSALKHLATCVLQLKAFTSLESLSIHH
jgi:hypothetical protein